MMSVFRWAVTIGLDPADVHPERITQRVKDNSRNLCRDGVEFPAKEKDLRAFERANPDIAINIFGWEKNGLLGLFRCWARPGSPYLAPAGHCG